MVVVMGGITIWLHDETFIKVKPTLYYLLRRGLLGFGLKTGRQLLKMVLGSAYPGLDEDRMAQAYAQLGAVLPVHGRLNEAVWRNSSTDFWVGFKLWGAIPLTFLFALANMPMLLRHGLTSEEAEPAEPGPVE
jgi:intracellular septation protein